MLAMTVDQHRRCAKAYHNARGFLEILAESPLNLDVETRRALDDCRGALERFDYLRSQQPTYRTTRP